MYISGIFLVFCLLLLPVKLADIGLRYGACLLILGANLKWIEYCLKAHGHAHVESSTSTIEIKWLGPVWTSKYNQFRYILNEKNSNLSVYGTMLCGLVCFNLIIMTVRLIGERVRTRDIRSILLFCLEITLHITTYNIPILKVPDIYVEIIVILVAQCINCLFYFRLFHINGYLQCVLFSCFLYIELQRVSYLVLILAILMYIFYVLRFGISMTNHVSAIIRHLEHLDLQTMFQRHHYRNILVSCFFYALFNLLFTGIQAVLTEDVHLTVTMFCTSWVGTWCLIIMVFYVTRAIIACTVFYMRGFKNVCIRIENPRLSDVWIMVVLAVQSSESDTSNHGLYMTIGILMTVIKLLNEIHSLSEPVLMELIAYKDITKRQILVFLFFICLALCPVLIFVKFSVEMYNTLDTYCISVIVLGLFNTTVDCMVSLSLHFAVRFSLFDPNLIFTDVVLAIPLFFNLLCTCAFVLWCISNIRRTIPVVIMLVLSSVYIYCQLKHSCELLKQRRYNIVRLLWKPSKWDKQLVPNGNNKCTICLCILDANALGYIKMAGCNHYFHESCFQKWRCFHGVCPLCK